MTKASRKNHATTKANQTAKASPMAPPIEASEPDAAPEPARTHSHADNGQDADQADKSRTAQLARIPSSAEVKASVDSPQSTTFTQSAGLVDRLAQLNSALIFSSYQSGLLYMLGRKPGGGAHLHQSAMQKPMGICVENSNSFTLSAGFQIMRFENGLDANERVNDLFDGCYVARETRNTGELDAHDIGIDKDGRPLFINTRFNCLATTDSRHSFREIWRPPFVSTLVDEDRCHLNGLAMENGEPAYVTAVSQSDTIDGWRDRRHNGGIVIDVRKNEIICKGLSMPHSPRLYDGKLWLLNSGTGELGFVERSANTNGKFVPQVFCPGFGRGLAIKNGYAFVGLSKPRYQRFEGLALDDRLAAADSAPWCGIQIIDLAKRTCVDWFRIDGAVSEIYDVALLDGHACPMSIGPTAPEMAKFVTHRKAKLPAQQAIG
ncbi:MAG: TIGR03032 family protein [Parasphingorhabdus sp.]|uniref:TIGR03032 family protein n=1 Tax=Parasphingorhabdus sp. TaxID=2709688 RepID=UPI003299710D